MNLVATGLSSARLHRVVGAVVRAFVLAAALLAAGTAAAQVAVTSYHYDHGLTGWNDHEASLDYSTVPGLPGRLQFQPLFTVPLDGLVFAQPLMVPNAIVRGDPNPGTHDVVYVATYNNTIYAIDPTRGSILAQRTLDPAGNEPCVRPGQASAGINGTPVIDRAHHALYVIDLTVVANRAAYFLHAIDLNTLADITAPTEVSASQRLLNKTFYNFNAPYERQRAALAEVNGNIYAGFAGSCEFKHLGFPGSRGWVLGWQASTLQPLPLAELTDQRVSSPNHIFLTSVWMSGSGLAS
ncbi:MAG TPA: hypothetical protein VII63_09710, partial [Caulobacteraceae bacterium]